MAVPKRKTTPMKRGFRRMHDKVHLRTMTECSNCGHEFSAPVPAQKKCHECDGLNILSAEECMHCGASFKHEFTVTLREALRVGVIARGMEITEEDAVIGEDIADQVNRRILATGDERLINIIRVIPEEAYGQLAAIMTEATKN